MKRFKTGRINPCVLWILILGIVLPGFRLSAKLSFRGLDLSDDNRLLFQADSDNDGTVFQNALFMSNLSDLSLRQLTAFPEQMDLIENGRTIQVRNAFGACRIPLAGGLPRSIAGLPGFADGAPILGGRVEGMAASADGKWLLYVEPVTAAYGNLVLIDTFSGARTLVSSDVERPDRFFPASWSPDSRVFIYCRGGRLYYQNIGISETISVDERYRLIGEGSINSIFWGKAADFFYLRGSTVYRVRGQDLFARAMYANFLEIGVVAGKIPFEFDFNFDVFWIAPDSQSILLSKGGRNIFYYPLGIDDFTADISTSLPYILLPRSAFNLSVLWSPLGTVTVIASAFGEEGKTVLCYRLDSGDANRTGILFRSLTPPPDSASALSPDGTKALFWGERGVQLYDYVNWRPLQSLGSRPAYSCLWAGNEEILIGDDSRIERISLGGNPRNPPAARSVVCISSAGEFGFEERGRGVLVKSGGVWFTTDGKSPWTGVSNPALRPVSPVSGQYRVYLERQSSGPYENLPMVRNTASVGTVPLFSGPEAYPPGVPPGRLVTGNESVEIEGLFTHARREGLREVALCFDCYDDAAGLPEVLDALRRFDIRATFFLNGEFIRRHPGAVRDIAAAGHEAASMFFAAIDLSDSRYRIQGDFIPRGLARNEDEFFRAAGDEMSLLWHPPFYAVSSEVIAAAATAGYRTVGRDVDPLDWVGRGEARGVSLTQYSASEMIDRIMEQKQPGSIIPVRLGLLPGGRVDYLFNRINVLLDALVRSGYTIVPVSTLIEHAR
jgi:peptidoglycan/xylan/chitin deacetylase (PgdA/CDA1 family)